MGHEVEREIEWCDAENDTEREASRQARMSRPGGCRSHFDRMAVRLQCPRRRQLESRLRPLHFDSGQRHGFAGFSDEQLDEFVGPPADSVRDPAEQTRPFDRLGLTRFFEGARGQVQHFTDFFRPGHADFGDQCTVVRIVHRRRFLRADGVVAEKKRTGFHIRSVSRFSTKIGRPSWLKWVINSSGCSASGIITPRSLILPSMSRRAVSAGGMPVCTRVSE